MTALADLMTEASKDGRVCPQPMIWDQLWELLPDRHRVGAGWEPPLPLILAACWEASDSDKRSRFPLPSDGLWHGHSDQQQSAIVMVTLDLGCLLGGV
jgi:hypothetical protein